VQSEVEKGQRNPSAEVWGMSAACKLLTKTIQQLKRPNPDLHVSVSSCFASSTHLRKREQEEESHFQGQRQPKTQLGPSELSFWGPAEGRPGDAWLCGPSSRTNTNCTEQIMLLLPVANNSNRVVKLPTS